MLDQEYMLEKMLERSNQELVKKEKRFLDWQGERDNRTTTRKIKSSSFLSILMSVVGRNASK